MTSISNSTISVSKTNYLYVTLPSFMKALTLPGIVCNNIGPGIKASLCFTWFPSSANDYFVFLGLLTL